MRVETMDKFGEIAPNRPSLIVKTGPVAYPIARNIKGTKMRDALKFRDETFMLPSARQPSLSAQYQAAHNVMRNVDGLQPQEALDELLKYLFFKEHDEAVAETVSVFEGFASNAEITRDAAAIRRRLSEYLRRSPIVPSGWVSDGFLLSDLALVKVHSIFQGTKLLSIGLDLRSSALREFISGPIRKGLGIFLTPDEVVRAVMEAVAPKSGETVLDPACGSGTFLFEAARFVQEAEPPLSIYGIDKNPRMMLLAEFNCGHLGHVTFKRAVADSLAPLGAGGLPDWFKPNSIDVILTNPPFGVSIDARGHDFSTYVTCSDECGIPLRSQGSEVMFIERCLELLKPGGRMGIVLPRSVLTNNRLGIVRERLARLGAVRAVVSLPYETFAATGTQTSTVALIVEKFGAGLNPYARLKPVLARIDNVGFDVTGRIRDGSQLDGLGRSLKIAMEQEVSSDRVQVLDEVEAGVTFTRLAQILSGKTVNVSTEGRTLASVVEFATTGKTPPRSCYADEGLFLVKVGNLTGSGISWLPRDRNFIAKDHRYCRSVKSERMLQAGDLLLTSSAHASKYIAKKVDVVTFVPKSVGGAASLVGEVMLLRPRANVIDPFLLLAYLRSPAVILAIQDLVRGQTAHLHPGDLLDLPLDEELLLAPELARIADLLRREADLNDELNELSFEQLELQRSLGEQPSDLEMAAE